MILIAIFKRATLIKETLTDKVKTIKAEKQQFKKD